MNIFLKSIKLVIFVLILGVIGTSSSINGEELKTHTVLFPARHAIMSSKVDSIVEKHLFREGETFKKGDILTEFDSTITKLQLIRAQGSLQEYEAGLGFSKQSLEVTQDLFERGMQGKQELERSILEVQVAEARVIVAQATLDQIKRELEDCQIIAPYSGRVMRLLIQEHEAAKPGQQVIQIIDDLSLLAILHLPSSVKAETKIGEVRKIKIDENNQIYSGKIIQISGEVDSTSRTFEIQIEIDNTSRELSPGMSGTLIQ